ncbi:MAG: DUF1588 domain-containing protein [Bdellovibrionales bacterium]|nr:DUF1588 domain-containing protein [Bdellovibrionales bacterium]
MKDIFCLILLILSFAAESQTLDPYVRLNKLSWRLRTAQRPSTADYAELTTAIREQKEDIFFRAKTVEYLKSPRHALAMKFRLAELFEIATPSMNLDEQTMNRIFGNYSYLKNSISSADSSLSNLFMKLAQENLSWDTLLVGKEYRLFSSENRPGVNDFSFFGAVMDGLPVGTSGVIQGLVEDEVKEPKSVQFAPDDVRIAGAITTARFFDRYTNVAINKDRRRAAAIFKIFMCDPMVPTISNGKDKKHGLLNLTFPKDYQVTLEEIKSRTQSVEKMHGSDAQCFACHKKLDPMGLTFQSSGLVIGDVPSYGALVFDNSEGKLVTIEGEGIGPVAKAVTEQPEYVRCQVRHFWKWFIGNDVRLTDRRLAEISHQFNQLGRRTNDFVSYLVNQPEFYQAPVAQPFVTFDQVKTLFTRCDSCHLPLISANALNLPALSKFPFGGSIDSSKAALTKISNRLTRPENDPQKMPQNWRHWQKEELDLLAQWIKDGARNEEGQALEVKK